MARHGVDSNWKFHAMTSRRIELQKDPIRKNDVPDGTCSDDDIGDNYLEGFCFIMIKLLAAASTYTIFDAFAGSVDTALLVARRSSYRHFYPDVHFCATTLAKGKTARDARIGKTNPILATARRYPALTLSVIAGPGRRTSPAVFIRDRSTARTIWTNVMLSPEQRH